MAQEGDHQKLEHRVLMIGMSNTHIEQVLNN